MTHLDKGTRQRLLDWYDHNRRDLPWRRTSDPYAIWVSEVMLQQTQVATVERYWTRWMARFPTLESLAAANEQEVLAAWQGLGYYRRCRMLMAGAKILAGRGVPATVQDWREIPGIGRYTAGAIASIAQGVNAPLVDGNVERVYARLCEDHSEGAALKRRAWTWAEVNVDCKRPGDWNQALMELGATICLPGTPRCGSCPLSENCLACGTGHETALPAKPIKPTTIHLNHVIWIPWDGSQLGIRQIPTGNWWQGMWEFPRSEEARIQDLESLLHPCQVTRLGSFHHSVTHHRIQVEVSMARVAERSKNLTWKRAETLDQVPMPSPQRRALKMAVDRGFDLVDFLLL